MEEEGRSKVASPWTGERERFVVAALNLGKIEINGRDRESMGEKK
jgi:hypothetical protein